MPTRHEAVALLIVLLLQFTPAQPSRANAVQAASDGKYGGTAVIGLKGDFDSLNELNAGDADALQVIDHLLFMSLTRLDAKLKTVPYLAEAWQFSPGDTVLTFHLRQDVFWTDGPQTTAEDVLFTYHVATDPATAYPAASRFDLVKSADLVDRFTVRFHLAKNYPDVLHHLQMPILPKHLLAGIPAGKMAEAAFNRRPIGNGPYILKEWLGNQKLVFEANPDFALGRPYLDRIVFVIIPDETVLFSNLLSGEVDIVPALTPEQKNLLRQNRRIRLLQYHSRGYTFAAWNLADPRLTKRVRQALTYAIDREEIIATLLEGSGQPIQGPIMPFVWAYDPSLTGIPFDLRRARALLAREGWRDSDGDGLVDKNGKPFLITLKTNAESRLRRDVAVMIQAQLAKIGIMVRIQTVEWNLLLQQVFEKRDFDGLILGWDADFAVDPAPVWHSRSIESGYNFIGYKNPRVDELLESGRTAGSRESARKYWFEFQRIIAEDCPYTFLFMKDNLAGISSRVHDVQMDERGFLANVTSWWIPADLRKYSK